MSSPSVAKLASNKVFLLLLAVVVAVVVAVSTPAVRKELKQSFSPVPAQYTELYFTRAPVVAGGSVLVPVSVDDRGPGDRTHRLRVSVEAADGRTTASTTTALTPRSDAPASAVSQLPLPTGSVIVRVALLDSSQSLHFRLPAQGAPAPGGTP
ncbi:hypothetical protein Q5762_31745 [Streptomyces sp. P9(2023)]|uniref:hypothetical protein n=1 Tax=Streptomyces sp. P9(2023) TaxID=3064394 RepID=UPI0028F3EE10|nr:hypothetical protein [Streptomyces sp. P9(2023)]MDT9692812.1 hypothetical protein [Streptomyces sp. P9(2023)]